MRIFISLLLVFTSTNLLSQDITEGLIAHYTFSGDANDLSGNGNHGTNFGAELTDDRFGNPNSAYAFNGMDSYISVPSSASLESPDTAITMSAWIYSVGFSFIGDNFGPILMKSDLVGNNFMYRMDIYEEGFAAAINNWTNFVTSETDIPMNEWHHLAISFCSTEVKFYIDNVLISEAPFVCSIIPDNLPLEIGRDVPGALEVFNGVIDDIRIYDRCVSDEEINALFEEVPTGLPSIHAIEFSLSPNPSSGTVTVSADNQILFEHIQLIDMLGRVVKEQYFSPTNVKVLDVSGLKKGLYSLLLIDEQSISSTLLMVN